jgi:hypothetical protein
MVDRSRHLCSSNSTISVALKPLEILLLCDYRDDIAATVREHIDALTGQSRHRIQKASILGDLPPRLDLAHFDAVVIHYSLILCHGTYVSAAARATLAEFKGLKAIFIQDEYRFIDATVSAMREAGVDVLFTCVPQREIEKVYPSARLPGVVKVNVLTGYVPEALLGRNVLPYSGRPIDLGFRARKVPAWLGELGQEKYTIGQRFRDDVAADNLRIDISFREEDRLYGDDWIKFVANCKAMLGVESGASVFDFTGEIQRNVENHARREPGVTFETLKQLYFAGEEGKFTLNQISPRCFEAAALRTLLVMYEGEYSGRMTPWRHYVPLKKDHSNHAEVVAVLKDGLRAQQIIDAAYREVACNPQNMFQAFVDQFDGVMEKAFRPDQRAALAPLGNHEFAASSAPGWVARRRWITRRILQLSHRLVFSVLLGRARPETRETVQSWLRYLGRPLRFAIRKMRA